MVIDFLLPGFETPFHIHEDVDEFFCVIKGKPLNVMVNIIQLMLAMSCLFQQEVLTILKFQISGQWNYFFIR